MMDAAAAVAVVPVVVPVIVPPIAPVVVPAAAPGDENPIVLARNVPRALEGLLRAPYGVTHVHLNHRGWAGHILIICNENFVDIRAAASRADIAEILLEAVRRRGVQTVERLLQNEVQRRRKRVKIDRVIKCMKFALAVILTLSTLYDLWSEYMAVGNKGTFLRVPTDIHPILYRALILKPGSLSEGDLAREEWEYDVVKICDANKITQEGDNLRQRARRVINLISLSEFKVRSLLDIIMESVTLKILFFVGSNVLSRVLPPIIARCVDHIYGEDD